MTDVYISLGSNVDRELNLRRALSLLQERFGPCRCSAVYESEAVGFEGDPFLNLAAGFDTDHSVYDVVRGLKEIEDQCGRSRCGPRFSPRTLDLDLLLYGDLVTSDNGLRLPRDEIVVHGFVLKPLAEIAGKSRHPTLGRTFEELWSGFDMDARMLRPFDLDLSRHP